MSKVYRIGLIMIAIIILRHSKLHNYAGNMRKHVPHISRIYMHRIFRQIPRAHFPAYFASKSSAYFKKILRYKPTSLYFDATLGLVTVLNCGAGR